MYSKINYIFDIRNPTRKTNGSNWPLTIVTINAITIVREKEEKNQPK